MEEMEPQAENSTDAVSKQKKTFKVPQRNRSDRFKKTVTRKAVQHLTEDAAQLFFKKYI